MQPRNTPQPAYQPPQTPQIPIQALNSLIPRITTTINDIDAFKNLLAAGNADGSMPTWDALLQRYSLLLGRITALSEYISRPTPSTIPTSPRDTTPALSKYIVHPLNPIPGDANPLAGDAFFQALNTLPLPDVDPTEETARLKAMREDDVGRLLSRLKSRVTREAERSRLALEEVERVGGEMDWELRIDDEGDADAELEEVKAVQAVKEEKDEDDEDLFGDDEDDDIVMIDPPPIVEASGNKEKEKEKPPNPREGWTVVDYVQFMETGKEPTHAIL